MERIRREGETPLEEDRDRAGRPDAYKSICESFIHAGAVNDCKVKLRYVNSEKITRESAGAQLGKMSGILVAPGFGNRGIEGKIEAVRFARENNIPFLGICLGMQCAVIEFARHVLNLADANSSEMEQTPHPVIDLMEEQKGVTAKGGTMRLGAYWWRSSRSRTIPGSWVRSTIPNTRAPY